MKITDTKRVPTQLNHKLLILHNNLWLNNKPTCGTWINTNMALLKYFKKSSFLPNPNDPYVRTNAVF